MATKRANGSEGQARTADGTGGIPPISVPIDGIGEQDGDGAIPTVNVDAAEPTQHEPAAKRGRGRPAGSTSKPKSPGQKAQSKDITAVLMSLHMMGAALTGIDELKLEKDEAQQLASAIDHVNEVFGIPKLSEKASALIDITAALATVYGTRIVAIAARKKDEAKKAGAKPSPQPVTIDGSTGKVM
jgi:hypothetical protein